MTLTRTTPSAEGEIAIPGEYPEVVSVKMGIADEFK
jgi:hypothetical protein